MQVIKDHPAFESPREKLVGYFSRGDLSFSANDHVCFVCGAAGETLPDTHEQSLRAIFVDHVAADANSRILCVRAESATQELLRQPEERRYANFSLFEKIIAETVDSVLIFPESPGSFAELGYFSAHDDIAAKCLVAIRRQYQANSFITLGPIRLVAKASAFGPIPYVLGDDPAADMATISARLLGDPQQKRPYRRRFARQPWKDLDSRSQLSVLGEIVDIAGAITEVDLLHVVYALFGAYDVSKLRMQLALLVATNRAVRNDTGDLLSRGSARRFMDGNEPERMAVIGKWRDAYATQFPDVIEELEASRQ